MLPRLRLALLCALLVVLLPVWPAGAATLRSATVQASDGPSIDADRTPISSDLRASERVELVVGTERPSSGDAPDTPSASRAASLPVTCQAAAGATGCGLVHCRRLAGALLLHYATPPPARG